MEVLYINVLVWGSLTLTPQQQTFLGGHFFNGNVLNSETQDDRPDHTQRHLQITVDNFFGTNRYQFYALRGNEVKGFIHVGDLIARIERK